MINYRDYEKQVYSWLMKKHENDKNFTFSVRINGSKGAELDYFIGTKKSNYFGTTFWSIPVSYPGSASDCIDLFFGYYNDSYNYKFEFKQTKSPNDSQNESALNFVESLIDSPIKSLGLTITPEQNKMLLLKTKQRQNNYTSFQSMLNDIENDLEIIIPVVQQSIIREKSNNPGFIAHRINLEDFENMQNKLKRRFEKYKNLKEITTELKDAKLNIEKNTDKSIPSTKRPLNQIFYGPPGTGKTYKTISAAISIINPNFDLNQKRDAVKKEYHRLTDKGNIVFTTFHQSMSYEDFIEGIKPVLNQDDNSNNISYEIKEGTFKAIAEKAKGFEGEIRKQTEKVDLRSINFFKMSIGGKNRKDTHDWCINNNVIALGYGGKNDLNQIATTNWKEYKREFQETLTDIVEDSSYSIRATYYFKNTIQIGDIVLISLGNHIIDAIGVVKGNYKYSESTEVPYHHFRDVEWIATNLNANPNLFLDKNISQQTIYQFDNNDVKINYLENILTKEVSVDEFNKQNYVLIIDEINRGNVSAIFGELITLLEPDKRLGAKEEIKVTLPYSKNESFGVPSNLYIIGTMNTADRSVEALDSALRRRFSFTEMPPQPKLIKEVGSAKNGIIEDINLVKILKTINNRIEKLLDRDHAIGHSYFLKVKNLKQLKAVFANKVIPLLQEYFFGDYGKIGLVLGSGFVKSIQDNDEDGFFASFEDYDLGNLLERKVYRIKDATKMDNEDFKKALIKLIG